MIDRLSGNIEDGIEKIHQKLDAITGSDVSNDGSPAERTTTEASATTTRHFFQRH